MRLEDLQNQFVASLYNQDNASDICFPTNRLPIYRNNWQVGLIRALEETYPVCERLVGRDFFWGMAKQYIKTNPSYYFSKNAYGANLAYFIAHFTPAQVLPYLSDVAQLEWGIHQVLLGKEEKPFDWSLLAQVPLDFQEEIVFHRTQNSVLMASDFPIGRIWETNQPDYTGETTIDLALEQKKTYLLVLREKYYLKLNYLTNQEYQILLGLEKNLSLKELPLWLQGIAPPTEIPAMLSLLIQKGYLSYFSRIQN